ncbi:MAG: helix-turn-helix domain-containing protein [Microbacterium sp.]
MFGSLAHESGESPERLLTPDEAAVILRAKKNTLAAWRMTPGAGPDFVKRGRLVFYTPDAIHEYLNRNTRSGTD